MAVSRDFKISLWYFFVNGLVLLHLWVRNQATDNALATLTIGLCGMVVGASVNDDAAAICVVEVIDIKVAGKSLIVATAISVKWHKW